MENLINETLNNLIDEFDIDSQLSNAIQYAINSGGKRIRPKIVCLVYKARKRELSRKVLRMASAIELIHTASLIHDDLPGIDDDDLRRNKLTLHRQFDEATAILAGDMLFVKGPEILSEDKRLKERGFFAVGNLINGEFHDVRYEKQKIGFNDWIEMVKGKTAALIRLSFEVGAILGGFAVPEVDKLGDIGELIGIAYQMTDDLLDVMGKREKVGKRLHKDQYEGKCTALNFFTSCELKKQTEDYFKTAIDIINNISGDFSSLIQFLKILEEREK